MIDANINDLSPAMQILCREVLAQGNAAGIHVKQSVTWRNADDQNAAHANGLSNASAGESPHNCCNDDGSPNAKAFDYAIYEDNDTYVKDGTDPRYRKIGEIGKSLGLAWGGDWKHPDWDHLELENWKSA